MVRGRDRVLLGWDGASHARPPRTLPFPWGRFCGRGIPCIYLRVLVYRFRVGFHRCPRVAPMGGTFRERSRLRWGVRT